MSNEAKTTETSTSSDSVLRLTKRMKPTTTKVALSTTKYKGVVERGAQIYHEGQRKWLGTFKSAAEAAEAYDSASLKLNPNSHHRNFPWSRLTDYEVDFQKNLTKEDVLNMIRDGSYQHKFKDFVNKSRSQIVVVPEVDQGSDKFDSCTQLFQKKLTPSDVGKLNRLVIPKKYAVKYLPDIGGEVEDVEVLFYDRSGRQWRFRYCYWKSSQSFVFTRGWNGFVKEHNLKENDDLVFYTCHVPSNVKTYEGQSDKFLMIDVQKFSGNGLLVPDQVNKSVHDTSDEVMKTGNVFYSKLQEETKTEENKRGFMLFGVRIQ